jgi:O-antigen/teichoic acid export membrane protein
VSNSVRARFFFTVGANILRSGVSFITGMLVARWLGPDSYGRMAFLVGTMIAVPQLLDMGSSSAFFTFMSQRSRSKRFVSSFYIWLGIQFLIPLVVIGALLPQRWLGLLWRGEPRGLVVMAFVAVFLQNTVWPVVQQAGESQRQTRWVQAIGVGIAAAHLVGALLLWRLGRLGLYAIFGLIALEYLFAAFIAHKKYQYAPAAGNSLQEASSRHQLRSFLRYCYPLIPYTWIGFGYVFADDWLLQTYGGSVQQAYYAVASQFSAIALLATTSILRIFWKEIAEAHHKGDHDRATTLYRKVSRLLFLVGATVAGFFMPWTTDLLRLVVGASYVGGATTMAIMFLYPVHQSMGQIGGTMLYATERVSVTVITGIVFMLASMVVTYFVLAPSDARVPGLGFASEGLAIKMVVMQVIQVNVVAYIIARASGRAFDWVYQPISLFACIGLGWLAHSVAVLFAGSQGSLPIAMATAGLLYSASIATLVYALPSLAGLTRSEILMDLRRFYEGTIALLRWGNVQPPARPV